MLWLFGAEKSALQEISLYILTQEKNRALETGHNVLYIFNSITRLLSARKFAHTLLHQILRCSPPTKSLSIIQCFLDDLLGEAFRKEAAPPWVERGFDERSSHFVNLERLLDAPGKDHLAALSSVLEKEQRRSFLLVDGFETSEDEEINGQIWRFTQRLRKGATSIKLLLTSEFQYVSLSWLDGPLIIRQDRGRKGSPHNPF
jgi:hypothetical protein